MSYIMISTHVKKSYTNTQIMTRSSSVTKKSYIKINTCIYHMILIAMDMNMIKAGAKTLRGAELGAGGGT